MDRFALIKLGGSCDNECLFCHARSPRDDSLPTKEALRRIISARDLGFTGIMLSGGEPTCHPDILTFARVIQKTGLKFGLITNGRRLASTDLRSTLISAGLTHLHLSLHGSTAAVHDPWTGQGSYQRAMETLRALAPSEMIHISVTTVVAGFNTDDLVATVEVVGRAFRARPVREGPRKNASHRLALIEPKGRALANPSTIPRLKRAADSMQEALAIGLERYGAHIEYGFDGLPDCLAPPPPARLLDLAYFRIDAMQEAHEDQLYTTDASVRKHAVICEQCARFRSCPGLYPGYLPEEKMTLVPFRKDER